MCSLYKYQSFCVYFPSIGADRKLLQYENHYSVLLTTSLSLESKISDHKNSLVSHYTGVILLKQNVNATCAYNSPMSTPDSTYLDNLLHYTVVKSIKIC